MKKNKGLFMLSLILGLSACTNQGLEQFNNNLAQEVGVRQIQGEQNLPDLSGTWLVEKGYRLQDGQLILDFDGEANRKLGPDDAQPEISSKTWELSPEAAEGQYKAIFKQSGSLGESSQIYRLQVKPDAGSEDLLLNFHQGQKLESTWVLSANTKDVKDLTDILREQRSPEGEVLARERWRLSQKGKQ